MPAECPFCGSPAAAWPAYASAYVRQYHLCELHMGQVLERASVKVYDPVQVERLRIWEEVNERVNAAFVEMKSQEFIDSVDDEPYLDEIIHAICSAQNDLYPDLGEPIKVTMQDFDFDAAFSSVVMRYAVRNEKGEGLYRCTAHNEGAKDGRCTRYASIDGGMCEICAKSAEKQVLAITHDKLKKILEIASEKTGTHNENQR